MAEKFYLEDAEKAERYYLLSFLALKPAFLEWAFINFKSFILEMIKFDFYRISQKKLPI